jgi:hypothetical protein
MIKSIPADLTPSLQTFESSKEALAVTGPAYFAACDPYGIEVDRTNPQPCLFGDTTSSKTIVLVGDSNVGDWAPGLDSGLKSAGYRLAVFGFAGCLTPDVKYHTLPGTDMTGSICSAWHAALPAPVQSLHPVAVIAVAGASVLQNFTNAQWIAGFQRLYAELAPRTTVRILIGTSPRFREPPPTCLAAHPRPQACAMQYKIGVGFYGAFLARDPIIASAAHATLIPTQQWFCSSGDCSPVIGRYLAYGDTDHLAIPYAKFLSTVVTDAVLRVLSRY